MNKTAAETLIDTELERFQGANGPIRYLGDAIVEFETSLVTEADKRPFDEKRNPYLYRWPCAKNIADSNSSTSAAAGSGGGTLRH